MNNLLANLGLDEITADPNDIPVGNYDGEVMRSEYVLVPAKDNGKGDTVNHAITLRVTEGDTKGAQKQVWYTIGNQPRNANGEFPSNPDEIATFVPAMSDQQKSYYKKLHVDLGIAEQDVVQTNPTSLVGKQVSFRIYTSNGFKNVGNVALRVAAPDGPVAADTHAVSPF